MRAATHFILFQVAWFASVLGAARGFPLAGPAAAALLVAFHLSGTKERRREAGLIAVVAVVGGLLDTLLQATGVLSFVGADAFAPAWIVALWVSFATLLNSALRWLQPRLVLAALLGAVGGPLSYLAGERLGAVLIHSPLAATVLLAVEWAVLTPVLLSLARSGPPARPS